MSKIKYTDFKTIKEVIEIIDFGYNELKEKNLECLKEIWISIVGKNISKISKIYDILKNGNALVICADSYIANELYLEKETLLKKIKEKTENMGIKIKDIKFDYKKWEEKDEK